MTLQEAWQIAETKIRKQKFAGGDSLFIIEEEILEKEYAWIFPYTSKKYWETKDICFAIGGNAPLFISKLNGQVHTYPTGLSIDHMIDQHEEANKLWELSINDIPKSTGTLLILKKELGWTQERLITFRNNKDKTIDRGSKKRLLQIQSSLTANNIRSELVLKNK